MSVKKNKKQTSTDLSHQSSKCLPKLMCRMFPVSRKSTLWNSRGLDMLHLHCRCTLIVAFPRKTENEIPSKFTAVSYWEGGLFERMRPPPLQSWLIEFKLWTCQLLQSFHSEYSLIGTNKAQALMKLSRLSVAKDYHLPVLHKMTPPPSEFSPLVPTLL